LEIVRQAAIAGGLAVLGTAGGVYAAALRAYSRSRLEELLRERDEEMTPFLRHVVEEEAVGRLAAALWHAFAVGGFRISSTRTWSTPAVARENGGQWLPIVGYSAALLGVVGLLRALSGLAGEAAPERLIHAVASSAWLLTTPLRPLARLILAVRTIIARGLGRTTEKSEEDREEAVLAAVSDGVLDEVVEQEQKEMIASIFELKDADVADILTPRTEMVSIEVESSVSEAICTAIENGHSRLPVHAGTRDNVVGIFYVRDALQYWDSRPDQVPALRDLMRKPLFIPETKKISELLQEMQRGKVHLGVVLDEYGGTAGLVTIEDVLEEIVGEIQDEFDEGETAVEIERIDDDTIIADGQVHVHEVNHALDMDRIPEDDDYETLAGFVLDELGHIPEAGESFEVRSLRIEVLSADERRVGRVKVERTRATEE